MYSVSGHHGLRIPPSLLYSSWPVEDSHSPQGEEEAGSADRCRHKSVRQSQHIIISFKSFVTHFIWSLSRLMPALYLLRKV